MGKKFTKISPTLQDFIQQQKVFFVSTAMREGLINTSPKGTDSFHILNETQIVWLNLTGSGNETAAHLLESDRMTILFCAFEGNPLILRLYGTAKAYHERDEQFAEYVGLFPPSISARQIIIMDIDLVQTSCGFGVPLMDYKADRQELVQWLSLIHI